MNIQKLIILFSLLISISSFGQVKEPTLNSNPLEKVDELIKVRQPNAAQEQLWLVIEKAKKDEDHATLMKSFPYFNLLLAPLDMDERAALYFKILKSAKELPVPSNSIAQLQMIQEMAYNQYSWFNYNHLKIYDSINMSIDSVRHQFILENIQQLEKRLKGLNMFGFQSFEEVLIQQEDSLNRFQSLSDYLAYQLIQLYQSPIIMHGGILKTAESDQSEWYAKSNDFTKQKFEKENLTEAVLNLYQTLERNNANAPDYLSTAVHQRLHYLKTTFNNNEVINNAWQEQFDAFKETSARSKFLFEISKNQYLEGREYHFKNNPDVEGLIKSSYEALKEELSLFPKNDFRYDISSLIKIIENKEFTFSIPDVYSLHKQIPLLITHKNYSNQTIRVYKIEDFDPLARESLKDYALKNKLTLINTVDLSLKNKNLFQERSTELLLGEISTAGQYFIIASDHKKSLLELASSDSLWNAESFISTQFTISNISTTSSNFNSDYTVLVLDQKTGEPVQNAEVSLYYTDYRRDKGPILLKKGKTNKEGMYSHALGDNRRIIYTVKHENSILYGDSYTYREIKSAKVEKVELFTDRSVYRPGQTVYFKGIAFEGRENDFKVLAKKKLTVTLKDASHQEVYRSTFITNEFGSIDGSIQLPESTSLGSFTLGATIEGLFTNVYGSSTQFLVEEYKRPTFEIKLNQPKEEAKLDEIVSVTGNAVAFAGFPITNAQVSYTVYRKWNRFWRYYYAPTSGDLLKEGELKSDQNGEFKIDFLAATDPNAVKNAYYSYELKVKVTDLSGETHEQTLSLNLSTIGLSMQVNAANRFFTHNKEYAVIEVVNLAGVKQSEYNGIVQVYKKASSPQFLNRIWNKAEVSEFDDKEFSALFPNMKRDDADTEKEELIKTVSFKTGDSLKLNNWINNQQGNYVLKFYALTKEGDSLKAEHTLEVIDVKDREVPSHIALWTFTSAENVEVGNSVDFQVGSSFKNAKALVSFYRKGELISQEWVSLKNRYSKCYTVQESDRGVLTFDVILFNNGVFYSESRNVNVPFSNKKLNIATSTFRDLLQPGQKEQWSFTIKDENKSFVKAELAAAMYDASLDQFRGHSWGFFPYYGRIQYRGWSKDWSRIISFMTTPGMPWELNRILNQDNYRFNQQDFRRFRGNDFKTTASYSMSIQRKEGGRAEDVVELEEVSVSHDSEGNISDENESMASPEGERTENTEQLSVTPRTNFNETAFFYPTIYSNDSNEYVLNFTLPESLTKWKLLMLGHNKELQIGAFQKEIIAQKELMVTANAPRFVRQGDAFDFSAKVVNLTKEEQTVEVFLKLENPMNGEVLNLIGRQPLSKMVTIVAGGSEEVVWNLNVGDQEVIQYTITASNESFNDGERNVIPVLSNRVLITETDHVILRKPGISVHEFDAFKNQNSPTLDNKSYTIEYTDNLAWNAVLALPYLSKENGQSVTGLINSYYANAIAENVVNTNPQIQTIFNQWKSKTPDVFLSELEKNEELKTILLNETPWVMDAQNETEQRRRIGQLFELNQLRNNQQSILNEIKKRQNSDGGFGWFGGGKSNAYITQNVLTRLGQLERLGISIEGERALIQNAERFLTQFHVEKYNKQIKDKKGYSISAIDVYWLYSRTFFNSNKSTQIDEVVNYYKNQLKKDWTRFSPYEQSMIGIYFQSEGITKESELIYASLKDRAKKNTHLGMYWVENSGYYWYQNNIGSQAMIISFFDAMKAPENMMDDMRLWLMLNKESNAWETGVSTADAVYAILSTGKDYLSASKQPNIKVGDKVLVYSRTTQKNEIEVEWTPGLGQVKNKWTGYDISTNLGEVEVERFAEGPGVLNMYWQYTDELSKIKSSSNKSMEIQKTYRRIVAGAKDEKGIIDSTFTVGDKIEIELVVTVDRDLEFVHIKDLRPAGFEPISSTSGYTYDRGLSYYQSPKDVSMDYFVDYMPKGTYKLTYSVYATHSGSFNSGVAEIQCHYAPKFSGNSGTVDVRIGR